MDSSKAAALAELGHKISRERKKRGITLERLAFEMSISKGNLSDLEHGKKDPKYTTLRTIAKGLKLSVAQLLKDL